MFTDSLFETDGLAAKPDDNEDKTSTLKAPTSDASIESSEMLVELTVNNFLLFLFNKQFAIRPCIFLILYKDLNSS